MGKHLHGFCRPNGHRGQVQTDGACERREEGPPQVGTSVEQESAGRRRRHLLDEVGTPVHDTCTGSGRQHATVKNVVTPAAGRQRWQNQSSHDAGNVPTDDQHDRRTLLLVVPLATVAKDKQEQGGQPPRADRCNPSRVQGTSPTSRCRGAFIRILRRSDLTTSTASRRTLTGRLGGSKCLRTFTASSSSRTTDERTRTAFACRSRATQLDDRLNPRPKEIE